MAYEISKTGEIVIDSNDFIAVSSLKTLTVRRC